MTVVKVVKVLGTSEESWDEAAKEAAREASKTIDDIHGIEVMQKSANVEDGEITEFRTTVEVAFPVHDEERPGLQ